MQRSCLRSIRFLRRWNQQMADYDEDPTVIRRTARYEFFRRLLLILGVMLLIATLATTVVGVVLIRGTQQTGSPVLQAVLAGQAQIKDCTQPTGKCFQEGQKRQADIIGHPFGPINTVIVQAISCADAPGTQTAIEINQCVNARLKAIARAAKAEEGQ